MKTRSTEQKRQILAVLSDGDFFECGTPPYTASTVAHMLTMEHDREFSIDSVRRTLKTLEREGLVIAEVKPAEVLTGLGYIERPLAHYWNAETHQQDKAAADKWNDGAQARAEAALKGMFTAR